MRNFHSTVSNPNWDFDWGSCYAHMLCGECQIISPQFCRRIYIFRQPSEALLSRHAVPVTNTVTDGNVCEVNKLWYDFDCVNLLYKTFTNNISTVSYKEGGNLPFASLSPNVVKFCFRQALQYFGPKCFNQLPQIIKTK